jgi:hypothetical protein
MPEIIETTVFRLDELAEPAKDKARGWYREGAMSEDWYNFVYEDFETIAAMLGIQMKTQTVRLYGGELHEIAETLQSIQRRNFFQITADVTHRGHYYHEYAMDIVVAHESRQSVAGEDQPGIAEALRDLAHWLYRQLEREYEYRTSDAAVEESILANDYTFTLDGRRFG